MRLLRQTHAVPSQSGVFPIPHSPFRTPHSSAFSLLEVVLAITIAIGILVVSLAFYQQATSLRGQLLIESERLAAVRQVMDRLSADLRVAPVNDRIGFTGDSNSLRFVITGLPLQAGFIESDLRRISYRTTYAGEGTNLAVSGLTRVQEPALDLIAPPVAAPDLFAGDAAPAAPAAEPLTDAIRFLSFRFWDGTAWRDNWSGVTPPPGLEVSLGFEPLPPETTPDLYPGEIFRRVIFLPAGQPRPPGTNLVAQGGSR